MAENGRHRRHIKIVARHFGTGRPESIDQMIRAENVCQKKSL